MIHTLLQNIWFSCQSCGLRGCRLQLTKRQHMEENSRLRATLEEWSHRNAKLELKLNQASQRNEELLVKLAVAGRPPSGSDNGTGGK